MLSSTTFVLVTLMRKFIYRIIYLKTYHKIFCHERRKILFCYLDSTRITLAPRIHISQEGKGETTVRKIFPRGFNSPASLHIYPFPEEVIVIKHGARARARIWPRRLLYRRKRPHRACESNNRSGKSWEKKSDFFGENFSDVSKNGGK